MENTLRVVKGLQGGGVRVGVTVASWCQGDLCGGRLVLRVGRSGGCTNLPTGRSDPELYTCLVPVSAAWFVDIGL